MFIPSILQGATYYVVGTEDGYIRLYRRLTNQPAVVKPELGRPRSLPPLERHRDFERSSANSAVNLPLQSCAPGADNSIRVLLNTDETAEIFTAERIESAETLRLFLLPSSSKEVSFLRDLRKTRGFIGVTYENRGMHATLKTISSMMEGGRDLWVVELEPFEGDYRGTGLGEMACGNYSADQIAEMRARRILLDEKLPEYLTNEDEILRRLNNATLEAFVQGIGTQVQIKGSLIPILFDAAAGDMPGFLEAARLFSVFALHVSGVVEHVYELDMEMVGESELRVKFEGRRPRTYVNVEPTSIKIEGTCPLRR